MTRSRICLCFILITITISMIASAHEGKPCDFNLDHDFCTCSDSNEPNTEIHCKNVEKFPKFKPIDREITVTKLHIRGVIEELPRSGLDMFSKIEQLIIERTTSPDDPLAVQDEGQSIFANSSIESLAFIAFPSTVVVGAPSGAPQSVVQVYSIIDKDTLAKTSSWSIEYSPSLTFFDHAFDGAVNLKKLSLPHNQLKDGNFFRDAQPFNEIANHLAELDLSHNALENKKPILKTSVDFPNLKILLLNDNQLQNLNGLDFSKFPQLQLLDLSNNKHLIRFEGTLFLNESILEELRLDNCSLDELPIDALDRLPALKKLSLARSNITTLSENSFAKNLLLEHLDLIGNPISRVEPKVFSELIMLKNFSVIDWDLEILDLSIFGMRSGGVETLRIRDNRRLHTITLPDSLPVPTELRFLEISNNSLTKIDESIRSILTIDGNLFVRISHESNFQCPPVDRSTSDVDNPVTPTPEILSETTIGVADLPTTDTPSANRTQPLLWLAVLYQCAHRVDIAPDVFCAPDNNQNSTEQLKLIDYLTSLNPNCTGIEGTTTTTAPPTTPEPATTRKSLGSTCRLFDSLALLLASVCISLGRR